MVIPLNHHERLQRVEHTTLHLGGGNSLGVVDIHSIQEDLKLQGEDPYEGHADGTVDESNAKQSNTDNAAWMMHSTP